MTRLVQRPQRAPGRAGLHTWILALGLIACAGEDPQRPIDECACEADETCTECLELIGRCCYDEPGIPQLEGPGLMAAALARRCESDPSCRACCNECAALTCEELIESGSCPTMGEVTNGNRLSAFATLPLTDAALADAPEIVDQGGGALGTFAATVQCALPDGEEVTLTVDGQELTLPGAIGVAPEWRDGPCDVACQQWVTSCVGWKINNFGVRVAVFPRTSDHEDASPGRDGDTDTSDRRGFDVQEGAFYGNVFDDPQRLYGCRGAGRDPLIDLFRTCTHPDGHCGIVPVGPCLPGPGEDDSVPHACERLDEHGALRGCHSRLSRPDGTWPPDAIRYDRTTTVYLPETAFRPGLEASCGGGAAPGDHEVRPVPEAPGAVGDPCRTDDDCNAEGLVCRVWNGPGICVRTCEPSDDPTVEEAACGAGNTCLQHGEADLCVRACEPVSGGGAGCDAGRVCTNGALLLDLEEDPGCRNFCSLDSDCLPSQRCDRQGLCVLAEYGGPLESRLPDGEPCTVGVGPACRGICVPFGGEEGICGSLIDLAETDRCPDDPEGVLPTTRAGDDLAVCLFRRCADDGDCTAPLECVQLLGGAPQCTYR